MTAPERPLPCPFCGGVPSTTMVSPARLHEPEQWDVSCENERCQSSPALVTFSMTREAAIERWNRRAPSPEGGTPEAWAVSDANGKLAEPTTWGDEAWAREAAGDLNFIARNKPAIGAAPFRAVPLFRHPPERPAPMEVTANEWLRDEAWSFCRTLLEQGRAIQQDNDAGKYPTYEHLSARVDDAARERADEITAALATRHLTRGTPND